MKAFNYFILCCALLIGLVSCAQAESTTEMNQATLEQTEWTKSVPTKYLSSAEHQGTLWKLTYESKDYAGNGEPVDKTN